MRKNETPIDVMYFTLRAHHKVYKKSKGQNEKIAFEETIDHDKSMSGVHITLFRKYTYFKTVSTSKPLMRMS